ncbi:MAG: circularly permuted type 2 ATP-grasp protein, partial [Verrucomicrobiota bacterium]
MLDEALLPDGSFHPDWEPWSQVSQEEGSETIHTWEKVVRRLEREMGLTHFQDSTATSLNSPWSVDSVPWILGSDDWALIEKGLEQRVRLMKAIQQDLEGACRLLSERVLPPEIVFLHRGYLPQLHGLEPSPTLNAFDLARGPDGKMWVISHRHDITSGLGFALKNRSILSRALSTPFQRCRVRRLADFFRSWRDTLESCSSRTPRNCRVVFLSSEQRRVKAEDFFLANYLGYTLALPGDLTVRDRQVWLRSLGGLQRVDVLWRTVIGRDLDPLEIAPQPCDEWGLPALFSAIRANQVQVVNPPGSGVLESPAFVPFYRAICQKLLEEDLLLPSAATWWCGEPKALDHVLSNLSTLVIKSAVSRWDNRRQYGAKLSAGELSTLRQQILADPAAYVGQEEVHLSTTPSYRGGALHPAPSGLRTFAHSDLFGNVHVMPGGLGSVISSDGERERECTKDVWVRAEGPLPPHHSLWPSASDESAKTTTSF